MFWTRVATSAVLAPVALGAVYFGFPYFHILIAFTSAAVLWEYTQMVGHSGLSARIVTAIAVTVIAALIAHYNVTIALGLIAVVCFVLLVADSSDKKYGYTSVHAGLACVAVPTIGLAYVEDVGGPATIFWLITVVWATDIGAYITGRSIGGPKLAPIISPNKTWSGSAGGLTLAIVAAGLVGVAIGMGVTLVNLLYAAGLSVVAQAGDLFESKLKREHDVKDSGTWIPGHGGVMDRVDGFWMAAPVTALMCAAYGGGVLSW